MTFRELGVLPETAEALEAVGITTPFPIQEMTLPVALSGHDVIGQAKTGTGKTLGFGLPILDRVVVAADVDAGRAGADQLTDLPQALVVVPTRELCVQVTNDLLTAGKVRNVRVLSVYGGRAYEPQIEALTAGVDVVVGTPGRLLDLAGQRKLRLDRVRVLVLDEADEMLDLGFLPDVEKIIGLLPARRQTMLFSATMPGQVINLARRYMDHPTHIRATAPDDTGHTVTSVSQHVFRAHSLDKVEMVARILQAEGRGLAMIFCRTKRTAADVAEQLRDRGFAAGAVHGDLAQGAREQALRAFRNGKVDVLVCTDVAARGIDVEGVTHVVNYQCPEDEKTYLHRIGRTGRAGASGTAVTLVDWDDVPRWQLINKALELDLNDPLETYSTSPHLYEVLRIPAGTKGVLPRAARTRAGLEAEEIEDLGEMGGNGRGRGRARGRDGRTEEEVRPGRPRERRRTRGGVPTDAEKTAPAAEAVEPSAEETDQPRRRRRRRRRGGADHTPSVSAPAAPEAPIAEDVPEADSPRARRRTRRTADTAPTEAAPTPVAEPAVVPSTDDVPTTAPRRRTRRTAEASETAPAQDAGTTEIAAPEEVAAPAPRRTRRKANAAENETATAPETQALPATPDDAEAQPVTKPRRTRRKTDTAETAPAQDTEATDTPAPRRRARRTTAPEAEAAPEPETALEAADAPVAKPRRTRRKADAADSEPAVAEAGPGDVPAPARRSTRRTARSAAAAEPAEVPAEAPAPARRSRRSAEAADATAAPDAEGAVGETTAAPRARTRRKAVDGDAAETASSAPAPRRRTRRTAEDAAEVPGPRDGQAQERVGAGVHAEG